MPTTENLKLTNIDIWGPARVPLIGNAVYSMKFHDSGTSHRKTFFLKDRLATTTLYALISYKNVAEKVTGKQMIHIRTDDKGRIGSYTKLCDFTLLFMILQVELRLNKGSLVRPRLVDQVKARASIMMICEH
jgi:hypothetical protein